MKKNSLLSGIVVLVLIGAATGLAEVFPGLKPYLPDIRAAVETLGDNKSDTSALPDNAPNDARADELVAEAPAPTLPKSNLKTQSAILALSWTAAFCETKPDKRECRDQKAGRWDAKNFALHGLWPVEQYCSRTPYKRVPDKLWKAMQVAMPGTRSGLHKHEWEKHGTCYSKGPARYFADSIRLTLAFNKTPVRDLFAQNMGRQVSASAIRAAFDKTFGRGAGDRVLVHCVRDGNRTLVQELRIALKGDLASANLPVLLKQARPQKRGCKGGIIDRAGFQ